MRSETAYGAPPVAPERVNEPMHARELKVPAALADMLVGWLMLAFAIALWVGAGAFAPGAWHAQGPGTFPRGISLLLGVCSLLLLGRALHAWRAGTRPVVVAVRRPRAVVLAMALAAAYPPLIQALGYYPATAVWLPVLLWVAGCRKLKVVVLASLGFLLFSRIVFQQLLGTPMP